MYNTYNNFNLNRDENILSDFLRGKMPNLIANMQPGENYPMIEGRVYFFELNSGVLVVANFKNLPYDNNRCAQNILGFHIHEGESCGGSLEFADSGLHYNPDDCPHPAHAGDMPPIFSSNGMGFMAFLTNKFGIDEIVGKTVVLHSQKDDFVSQPSGHSGDKIACGVIKRVM